MLDAEYDKLSKYIVVLADIAKQYPGKTIENIIAQMQARRVELWKQAGLLDPPKQYVYGPGYIKRM